LKIPIDQITPDPNQPRKTFKDEALQELRDSFTKLGLIQPITVRPYNGKYLIIVGERRYRATLLKGLTEIECIIREDVDDKTAKEMQFAENYHMEPLEALEQAEAWAEHIHQHSMQIREFAKSIGVHESTVFANLAVARHLAPTLINAIREKRLTKSHAEVIALIPDQQRQLEIAQPIIDKRILGRKADEYLTQAKNQPDRATSDIIDDFLAEKLFVIEMARAEAVKLASEIPLETPEDKERAAKALLKEVKQERKKSITPEERTKIQADTKARKEEKERKQKEYKENNQPAIEEAKRQLLNDMEFISGVKKNAPKLEKRAKRKAQHQKALGYLPQYKDTERCQVIQGELRQTYKGLKSNSIDIIITDPPYAKDYLYVYDDLAEASKYLLKSGGSLLVMVGQSYVPEVMAKLLTTLNYHWIVAYLTPGGQSAQLWDRKVNTFWKPLLWFVKDKYEGDWVGDVTKSDVNANDKDSHQWGQSESGMADIIKRFSQIDDLILDPFMGAGTTGRVALDLGRRFIGIDKDEESIVIAKQRLMINDGRI